MYMLHPYVAGWPSGCAITRWPRWDVHQTPASLEDAIMPAPVAPGIVAMEAIWTIDGQLVENTFHYKPTVAITPTLLQSMANNYIQWASANYGMWSTQTGLVRVQLRDLSSATGIVYEEQPVPPVTGHSAGIPLSNNCAIAIKRQSGLRGRANRGRVYHFGLTEDFMQSFNTLSVSQGNTFVAAYDGLLSSMATTCSAPEVILHRATGTSTPVQNYVLSDNTIDSQRRRLPGHNRHR